jgi:hypothetical protein
MTGKQIKQKKKVKRKRASAFIDDAGMDVFDDVNGRLQELMNENYSHKNPELRRELTKSR